MGWYLLVSVENHVGGDGANLVDLVSGHHDRDALETRTLDA